MGFGSVGDVDTVVEWEGHRTTRGKVSDRVYRGRT